MDNANFTYPAEEVIQEIMRVYRESYGVPRAEIGHDIELRAYDELWRAREIIAKKINASPEEIIFTSGTSESNNLAIKGYMRWYRKNKGKGKIITTPIERRCILHSANRMGEEGHTVARVSVDGEGFINMEELQDKIRDATLLTMHHANHEIGVIQDIKAMADLAEDAGAIFHVDATHSFLRERIDVNEMSIDMLTISAHTVHGPLGVGALYVREGLKILPMIEGDTLEFGLRAGAQNIADIAGFAKAVEIYKEEDVNYMRKLQKKLLEGLMEIEESYLNGPPPEKGKRVCDNINISFRGAEGEAIMLLANHKGLIIRTGSACYSESLEPSYVIRALGKTYEDANSSTRFSLSRYNTEEEIKKAVEIMKENIDRLRAMSPVWRR